MKRHILATTALTLALMSAVPALAAEGMWLPNQTKGIAPALKEAGLKLDTTELGNLQVAPFNAIVSLGGCSAAFLSPEGLVATNHHCVYGSIQYNSKPGQDYLTDGFLAKAKSDEVPAAPGSRIFVIEDLRDVTAEMNKGLKAKMTGLQRFEAMEANRKGLVDACEKQPNRRCDVRAYFGGAVYYLQQQLEIKDVRLVYAPAGGIGNYGGETDNWQWPRHTGDFGFYRAYVSPTGESAEFSKDNVPYKPKAWLTIAKEPLRENDYVMVAGFPGTTSRLVTAAEAKFNFEKVYPLNQRLLAEYSDAIMKATQGDQAAQIKYASILKGSDNYKKKLLGEMAGADAINLAAVKDAEEAAFRAWVKADPKREKQYAADIAALDALIADGQTRTLANMKKGLLNRSQLLGNARTLYRWAKEQAKPEDKREAGFRPKDRSGVVARLAAMERRFDAKVDRVLFEQALAEYNTLAADQRDAAFEAKLKELGVDRLYAETKLTDPKARAALLDQPASAFESSNDPFVQLAVILGRNDEAEEMKAKDRAGQVQKARAAYMQARLAYAASQGKTLYPDANGSLRFTYGKVTGRVRDGMTWHAFTTAEGIVAKHTGKGEFNSPQKQLDLIKAKDYGQYKDEVLGTLPVDFMSTVDITNGNSGSSTLNAKGEFVGLAFDGTLDGVISDWSYVSSINRTIHVDSRYMLWVMDKVDGAHNLLTEMGVK